MTTLEKIIEQIKNGQAENITEIDLSFNKIGDEGAIALAEALIEANLPRLEYISLEYNIIGDKGSVAFAKALTEANLPHLERIYLNSNKIGDAGAKVIADVLIEANLPHLEGIYLNSNKIGDAGAKVIADVLIEANLPHLKYIDLIFNQIGDRGAIAFFEALIEANLPRLKKINLIGNKKISDEWNKVIAEISETYISSNNKYLAEAKEKVKQELQQDWDSTAEPIKQALIDIEYAKLLQEEGKLKAAISLYGAALHGFRHLIGEVPKSLDVKQTIKQATEDMLFAINKLNGEIEELKLPVFVLECFEHLNAKIFKRYEFDDFFTESGVDVSLWDQNLAGIIFDMMPSKGQPAFFLDMFGKLTDSSSEEDSEDESDAYTSDVMGETGCCVS